MIAAVVPCRTTAVANNNRRRIAGYDISSAAAAQPVVVVSPTSSREPWPGVMPLAGLGDSVDPWKRVSIQPESNPVSLIHRRCRTRLPLHRSWDTDGFPVVNSPSYTARVLSTSPPPPFGGLYARNFVRTTFTC